MTLWECIGIGVLVSMRSMTLPATVSDHLAQNTSDQPDDNQLIALLSQPEIALLTKFMAAGEITFDKLPFTPNRTDFVPLLGRIGVAAAFAGTLANRDERLFSMIMAGLSAAVATHLAYQIRSLAVQKLHANPLIAGLTEDALVVGGSLLWRDSYFGTQPNQQ